MRVGFDVSPRQLKVLSGRPVPRVVVYRCEGNNFLRIMVIRCQVIPHQAPGASSWSVNVVTQSRGSLLVDSGHQDAA